MSNNHRWANHVEIAFWDFVIPAMTALQRRQTARRPRTSPRPKQDRLRAASVISFTSIISLSREEIKLLVVRNLYGAIGGLLLGSGIALVKVLL